MAKFTIYFKDKAIQSYIYDSGTVHIGRDDSNDLVIDNLDVAPAHAVIIIKADSYIIKQLNDSHPLVINKETVKEAILQKNDVITVGKHSIIFTETESPATAENDEIEVEFVNGNLKDKNHIPNASLQVMDGHHIGRILPLKKSMTRFGHSGSGVVIISKRKEGYFISSLESDPDILVNQTPIADKTIHLNSNDIVRINNISMQFFLES